MDKRMKGSRAARELALTRWRGTTPRERARIMTRVARARWAKATEEQKRAEGFRLVEARRRLKAAREGRDLEPEDD